MIPRYVKAPRSGITYHHRPGVYGIFWHGRDILLTYQSAPFDEYQLPGGGIDAGEHTLAALHRELLEETGWRVAVDRHYASYRNFTWMKDYNFYAAKLCHIFVGRAIRKIVAPHEIGHEAVLISPDDAVGLIGAKGDRIVLEKLLRHPYPRQPK